MTVEKLDAVADRGYFNSEEILACQDPTETSAGHQLASAAATAAC